VVEEEGDVEIEKRQDGQVYIPEHRGISRILRETIGGTGVQSESTRRSCDFPVALLIGYVKGVTKGESVPSSSNETVQPTLSTSRSSQLQRYEVPEYTGRGSSRCSRTSSATRSDRRQRANSYRHS
jgi:hypothetical protein